MYLSRIMIGLSALALLLSLTAIYAVTQVAIGIAVGAVLTCAAFVSLFEGTLSATEEC